MAVLPGCGAISPGDCLEAATCPVLAFGPDANVADDATSDAVAPSFDQSVDSPEGGGATEGGDVPDVARVNDGATIPDGALDVQSGDAAAAGDSDAFADAAEDGDAEAGDAGLDAAGPGAADGGVDIASGLVAYYPFDEASGTTSADATGNGRAAAMLEAPFSRGLRGNAATLNGTNRYVPAASLLQTSLADGLLRRDEPADRRR